jgi:hypothetical protein
MKIALRLPSSRLAWPWLNCYSCTFIQPARLLKLNCYSCTFIQPERLLGLLAADTCILALHLLSVRLPSSCLAWPWLNCYSCTFIQPAAASSPLLCAAVIFASAENVSGVQFYLVVLSPSAPWELLSYPPRSAAECITPVLSSRLGPAQESELPVWDRGFCCC